MLLLMFVAWSPKFPRWCARWVGWLAGHWRYCGLISAYRPHTCTDHHPPCNTPSSPCHSTHGLPTQPTKTNMIEIFSLKGTFISSTERLFMSFKVIYTYLGGNYNSLRGNCRPHAAPPLMSTEAVSDLFNERPHLHVSDPVIGIWFKA